MLRTADSGSRPLTGAITRSRYAAAAATGSRFNSQSSGASGTGVGSRPADIPKTSSRLDAGSVLTSSVRLPWSARRSPMALATVVFPTPPLPVRNRYLVAVDAQPSSDSASPAAMPREASASVPGTSRNALMAQQHPDPGEQQPLDTSTVGVESRPASAFVNSTRDGYLP